MNKYKANFTLHTCKRMYVCYAIVMYMITYVHCLQATGVASTQSSSALHQNTRAYDVPNVTADKDQGVNGSY